MGQERRTFLTLLVAVLIAFASVAPAVARHGQVHGIDPADMDLSADPRVDFYRYANGGWLDRTTIPPDEGAYGAFTEVSDQVEEQLLALLAAHADSDDLQVGTDEWKAVKLYQQGVDLATRNAQGIEPISPTLAAIDQIDDLVELHRFLEGSAFLGVDGLVPVFVFGDLQDSTLNVAYLGGPTFWLPNRDYYVEDDPANEAVRAAYVDTSAKLLTLVGHDPATAHTAAQAVYDLEHKLAEQTLTREEQQNVSLYYNPTAIAELATIYPLMDWPSYLQTLGIADVEQLIVTEIKYLKALDGIVRQTPMSAIKDHLKLQLIRKFRANLNEEIQTTSFEFRGKVLGGLSEQPPLEERALDQVNGVVGEALGKLYVAEHFPPEAKAQITELVEALRVAFHQRLEANPWMTPETKERALEKLAKLGVKVGYPDRWRSYAAVDVADSYAGTVLSALNAEYRRTLDQVNKPVDKSEWPYPPQTVNASYSPFFNEIIFPAGILQPPYFDYQADPASNFGAIGFFIGHEITHGFDLQGSQFDADGNLVDWWTPEDYERFQALNDKVVAQYGAIEVLPDLFIDGQITVTENVADMGGVQVAYDALEYSLATRGRPLPPPPLSDQAMNDGPRFTQEQRFFIAAATVWREKIRDESLTTQVKSDPHAPASVRATQPLRNMDEFFAAFDIQPGDPMYLPPEERIVVW